MLISLRLIVLCVISTSCLASAFSTLFVTEGADEEKKMEETKTKTQKTEGNSVAENQVVVETIPFFTNIFTKVEDVMNLSPLKVATIISAQHLLNVVKAIPMSNQPQNTLGTLNDIVNQFNKTAQIIKLTAEYVNISSHYILDTLKQFGKDNCDEESVKNTMKSINQHFLGVISSHIEAAVKEITKKTEHREMTGTDVLVSSAYHIVAAFQEMTNQVMSLKVDKTKCNLPKTPQNSQQFGVSESNDTRQDLKNPKQEAIHKSIKKDQALPNTEAMFILPNTENLQDTLTIENVNNPEFTIEIEPRNPLVIKSKEALTKEEVKIPESLKVAFLPEVTTNLKKNKLDEQTGQIPSLLKGEESNKKISKLKSLKDSFNFKTINPNEELTIEMIPRQNVFNRKKQVAPENKEQRQERFNVYYYPVKPSYQGKNNLPDGHLNLPEDFKANYPESYPESLKTKTKNNLHREKLTQAINPFKTLSLFGNSENYKYGKQQNNKYNLKKTAGTQTNFKSFDDTLTIENFNRQDLTAEVFSPEAFMHTGKDESLVDAEQERAKNSDIKEIKLSPQVEFKSFDNGNPKKSHEYNHVYHKSPRMKTLDHELASSAVDSLSNVPPASYESGIKSLRGKKPLKPKINLQNSLPTVLMPWLKGIHQEQGLFLHKKQQKHNNCDDKVEPVCGVDKNKSNFSIFLNDCQRKHHNSIYKTRYEWANMDTCVGFLLKYSSEKSNKYINIISK